MMLKTNQFRIEKNLITPRRFQLLALHHIFKIESFPPTTQDLPTAKTTRWSWAPNPIDPDQDGLFGPGANFGGGGRKYVGSWGGVTIPAKPWLTWGNRHS